MNSLHDGTRRCETCIVALCEQDPAPKTFETFGVLAVAAVLHMAWRTNLASKGNLATEAMKPWLRLQDRSSSHDFTIFMLDLYQLVYFIVISCFHLMWHSYVRYKLHTLRIFMTQMLYNKSATRPWLGFQALSHKRLSHGLRTCCQILIHITSSHRHIAAACHCVAGPCRPALTAPIPAPLAQFAAPLAAV